MSLASLMFLIVVLYIKEYVLNLTYEEKLDCFILTLNSVEKIMFYEEIKDFYFQYNEIVVVDVKNNKIRINYKFFKPLILLKKLSIYLDDGKFDYFTETRYNFSFEKLNSIFEELINT